MAQSYSEEFPIHQKTEFFDFRARRNPERLAEIARFADAFLKIVNHDFFRADFEYPIHALVLEDRASFQGFLRRQFRIVDPPNFGIYLSEYKLFVTYEDSGLGTFTHEIMHPLVERNLGDRPLWAMEGIPTFFEKFYGYWTNNEVVVHRFRLGYCRRLHKQRQRAVRDRLRRLRKHQHRQQFDHLRRQ